jgi:hypothetical protein
MYSLFQILSRKISLDLRFALHSAQNNHVNLAFVRLPPASDSLTVNNESTTAQYLFV